MNTHATSKTKGSQSISTGEVIGCAEMNFF